MRMMAQGNRDCCDLFGVLWHLRHLMRECQHLQRNRIPETKENGFAFGDWPIEWVGQNGWIVAFQKVHYHTTIRRHNRVVACVNYMMSEKF